MEFNAPPDTIGHFGGGHIQGGPKNRTVFWTTMYSIKIRRADWAAWLPGTCQGRWFGRVKC